MANEENFRALAKGLADRILLIFNQMKNESLTTSLLMLTIDDTEPGITPPAFNLPAYWAKLHYACEKITNDIDKLCIIYSKDSVPVTEPEYRALLLSAETSFSFLVTHFYTLPKSQGRTMFDMAHATVFSVVEAVQCFVKDMEEQGAANITLAFKVQSVVKDVKKLPQDNLKAAISALADEEALVADALSEIEEELKSFPGEDDDDDDEDTSWTEADTALVYPCVGIVKTARFCIKKLSEVLHLRGSCSTLAEIEQLDRLVAAGRTLSPAVDDLASALYPPVVTSELHVGARSLTDLVQAMLTTASKGHYVIPSDIVWIEVLRKTVLHNWKKLEV